MMLTNLKRKFTDAVKNAAMHWLNLRPAPFDEVLDINERYIFLREFVRSPAFDKLEEAAHFLTTLEIPDKRLAKLVDAIYATIMGNTDRKQTSMVVYNGLRIINDVVGDAHSLFGNNTIRRNNLTDEKQLELFRIARNLQVSVLPQYKKTLEQFYVYQQQLEQHRQQLPEARFQRLEQ